MGVGASPAAAARIEVGVYQDNPVAGRPGPDQGRRPEVDPRHLDLRHRRQDWWSRRSSRSPARTARAPAGDAGCPTAARRAPSSRASSSRGSAAAPRTAGLVALTKQLAQPEARADPAPDAGAQHALVRLVGHGQRQHARRPTWRPGSRCARSCRNAGGKRIQPAVGALRAQRARRRPRTPSRPTSRAPRRSIWWARADTTSAPQGGLAWTEPAALFEDAYREISALAPKPVLDRRDRLDRARAAARSSGSGGSARCRPRSRTWPAWSGSTCATATATSASARRRRRASPSRSSSSGGAAVSPRLKAAPRRRRLSRPVAGGAQAALTEAMVDRLMWRAGFGPDEAGRAALQGPHAALARWTSSSPRRRAPTGPAAVRARTAPR